MKEAENPSPSLIANCVFNSFLSYTATMLNIVIIIALRRTSSLPKTLKALIFSLAVSDLGVGLVVQPMYIARLLMDKQDTDDPETYDDMGKTFHKICKILTYASFFGVTAITIDRFLAIHLHLKHQQLATYQEIVTYKRVVAVVILSWLLSVVLPFVDLFVKSEYAGGITVVAVRMFCFSFTGLIYFKIYLAVRRHTNQVQAQEMRVAAQNDEHVSNFERLRKTAICTFYVYLLFLACHLPFTLVFVASKNFKSQMVKHLLIYTRTLLCLNSTLDPLIYCWKIRQIRCAVKNILRDIFSRQNNTEQD